MKLYVAEAFKQQKKGRASHCLTSKYDWRMLLQKLFAQDILQPVRRHNSRWWFLCPKHRASPDAHLYWHNRDTIGGHYTYHSYEAARNATSAIHDTPSQLCAVSNYKKHKRRSLLLLNSVAPCPSCIQKYSLSDKCPAAETKCNNCGHRGHWARIPKCSAFSFQCQLGQCSHMENYDRCCRAKKKAVTQEDSNTNKPLPHSLENLQASQK